MGINSWISNIPLMNEGYHEKLAKEVNQLRNNHTIYPSQVDIFNAFKQTPFNNVQVVLIGQDPYHSPGLAHGLAFSVPNGARIPPTLRNIFRELSTDLNCNEATNTDLTRWAQQGVFLLNSTLTVVQGKAGSHKGTGWVTLTDHIVETLSQSHNHLVYILWGNHARSKKIFVDSSKHLVLESAHPSPLSAHRGFFGSRHFSQTNKFLESKHMEPIVWR